MNEGTPVAANMRVYITGVRRPDEPLETFVNRLLADTSEDYRRKTSLPDEDGHPVTFEIGYRVIIENGALRDEDPADTHLVIVAGPGFDADEEGL